MSSKEVNEYAQGVLEGQRRALAKSITLVESANADHRKLGEKILSNLLPHTGGAVRLGITGVPGVGKSTFVESFGMMLVEQGKKVAVLAIDPSSSLSGGSILGDKTRMERLAQSGSAFIRPSPTSGTLGGVARRTRETMMLCEAAGFDVIIIETVGVGQSEIMAASMVDFFLVLLLPGAGDELQGIKKGLMEMAHALVVNKAEGDNRHRAQQTRKEYERALHMLTPVIDGWTPPVLTCSAKTAEGLDEVWNTIQKYHHKYCSDEGVPSCRKDQALDWMWELVEDGLKDMFRENRLVQSILPDISQRVEKGKILPTVAAKTLLSALE